MTAPAGEALLPMDSAKLFRELSDNYAKNILTNVNQGKSERGDSIAACASTFAILHTYSPGSETLARLKSQEPVIIENFLAKTSKLLSKHSALKIREDAGRWHFAMAADQVKALQSFKNSLTAESLSLQDVVGYKSDRITGGDLVTFSAEGTKIESRLDQICTDVGATILDAAYLDERAIYISPVVAKLWPKTASLVNHELGHLLENALVGSKISTETAAHKVQIDQCLRLQHPNLEKSMNKAKYAHEDWADFSGGLADGDDTSGSECFLLRDVAADPKVNPKDVSLLNTDPMDTHSTNFFRGITRSYRKNGSLSAACQAVIGTTDGAPQFRDCGTVSFR